MDMGLLGHCWALGMHVQATGSGHRESSGISEKAGPPGCGSSCTKAEALIGKALRSVDTPGRGRLSGCMWAPCCIPNLSPVDFM